MAEVAVEGQCMTRGLHHVEADADVVRQRSRGPQDRDRDRGPRPSQTTQGFSVENRGPTPVAALQMQLRHSHLKNALKRAAIRLSCFMPDLLKHIMSCVPLLRVERAQSPGRSADPPQASALGLGWLLTGKLAQTDRLRGDFEHLIGSDVFQEPAPGSSESGPAACPVRLLRRNACW